MAVSLKYKEPLFNALSASKLVIRRISVGETLLAVFVVVKDTSWLLVIPIRAVRATVVEVVGTYAEPCFGDVDVDTAVNHTRSSRGSKTIDDVMNVESLVTCPGTARNRCREEILTVTARRDLLRVAQIGIWRIRLVKFNWRGSRVPLFERSSWRMTAVQVAEMLAMGASPIRLHPRRETEEPRDGQCTVARGR